MSRATRSLEAGCGFPAYEKARQARGGHRGHVSRAARSLEAGCGFPAYEKARQARDGNRGHVSAATRSLEAGCGFPAYEKARQARDGNRGHVSRATRSLEAGCGLSSDEKTALQNHKREFYIFAKTSRRVSLADSFFLSTGKLHPASRERADFHTCPRFPPRAWRAISPKRLSRPNKPTANASCRLLRVRAKLPRYFSAHREC
ncbi:MAG: hypothetical protein FWF77_06880 [Defluviitaleaceae bacterium]|nr:hypothetical protein [Defluviitaleaceae bacterium]